MSDIDRRHFAYTLAACPVLALGACKRQRPPAPACGVSRTRGPGETFDAARWATLEAASARIIPSDGAVGAREAGVVSYIDAQLALPHFKGFQKVFRLGLDKLDQLAKARGSESFAGASADRQDEILRRIERGVRLGRRRSSKMFFRLLFTFTLEGFLSDPVYGGNRDRVGWRFIGHDPRPPLPQRPYWCKT